MSSGQAFDEDGLKKKGSVWAAEAMDTTADQGNTGDLQRWLGKARHIRWDYRSIVKLKGWLGRLK